MIVGISGLNGAGKGEAVGYLKARSFYAHSLSDVIRDELSERGLEPTRERMIEVGTEIRSS
jgi:dephospho-CoA kinase